MHTQPQGVCHSLLGSKPEKDRSVNIEHRWMTLQTWTYMEQQIRGSHRDTNFEGGSAHEPGVLPPQENVQA